MSKLSFLEEIAEEIQVGAVGLDDNRLCLARHEGAERDVEEEPGLGVSGDVGASRLQHFFAVAEAADPTQSKTTLYRADCSAKSVVL